VCYSVLQCVAVCCRVLQCVGVVMDVGSHTHHLTIEERAYAGSLQAKKQGSFSEPFLSLFDHTHTQTHTHTHTHTHVCMNV